MGYIRYASDVSAPVDVAFSYADNYRFVPVWLAGVSSFATDGDTHRGRGATFVAKTGFPLWHPSLRCEITEHRRDEIIEYSWQTRGSPTLTLRFGPLGPSRSVLTCQVDYQMPSGAVARIPNQVTRSIWHKALRHSSSRLRTAIEDSHGNDRVRRIA